MYVAKENSRFPTSDLDSTLTMYLIIRACEKNKKRPLVTQISSGNRRLKIYFVASVCTFPTKGCHNHNFSYIYNEQDRRVSWDKFTKTLVPTITYLGSFWEIRQFYLMVYYPERIYITIILFLCLSSIFYCNTAILEFLIISWLILLYN